MANFAYGVHVWTYQHAPPEYKALFNSPPQDRNAFIVWEQRNAPRGITEWVIPNGSWWNLWHYQQERVLDEHTRVYLLVETVKNAP